MTTLNSRDLDQARLKALERIIADMQPSMAGRLALAAAVLGLFAMTTLSDGALWRRCALAALFIVMLGVFVWLVIAERREQREGRRPGEAFGRMKVTLGAAWFVVPFLTLLILVSGGFDGPFLPVLVPVSLYVAAVYPRNGLFGFAVSSSCVVIGLALVSWYRLLPELMPAIFGGPNAMTQSGSLLVAKAAVMLLLIVWTAFVGDLIRKLFQGMINRALEARDEALRNYADHTRTLTQLSGEIAHELKNPLASVKGLAAMLDRDLTGKNAERMAVLRREVDRMEEILSGFLNFSRPLLPLQQQEVPLRSVCDAVVSLHEGLAHQRGVALEVREERAAWVWCDPRKVKQVLINLVQNALDASPAGTAIELVITESGGARALVEVRDRGPGLPASIRDRVFEAGVTTKPQGSGLGLSMARALARQHGGELELRGREGGGCVAALALPWKAEALAA